MDAGLGGSEARTEPYTKYGEEALELATPPSAKNIGRVSGSAAKQANVVRQVSMNS